jgi:hypothetical protein
MSLPTSSAIRKEPPPHRGRGPSSVPRTLSRSAYSCTHELGRHVTRLAAALDPCSVVASVALRADNRHGHDVVERTHAVRADTQRRQAHGTAHRRLAEVVLPGDRTPSRVAILEGVAAQAWRTLPARRTRVALQTYRTCVTDRACLAGWACIPSWTCRTRVSSRPCVTGWSCWSVSTTAHASRRRASWL